jgi:hypothetical protein
VKGSPGLDLLVWTITLPVSIKDAESFWNFIRGAPSALGQTFQGVNPFSGLVGQLVTAAMPTFDVSLAASGPVVIQVYLSDVLLLGGAGMMGGQALSQLSSLVPKV